MFSRRVFLLVMPLGLMATMAFAAGGVSIHGHYTNLDLFPTITGTLDLANTSMVETSSAYNNLCGYWDAGWNWYPGYVGTAYSNGWSTADAMGITSSYAAVTANATSLAVAAGDDYETYNPPSWYNPPGFFGIDVVSTEHVIMYTWGGDVNMDGWCTTDDYSIWVANYYVQESDFNKGDFKWIEGDLNFDRFITTDDYAIWVNSYYVQDADYNVYYGPTYAGGGGEGSPVPEPSAISLLLVAALISFGYYLKKK